MTNTYKDLIVWQKAIDLVVAVYEVTNTFPDEERFGLTSQMQRAAVSIPSNIAEGKLRGYSKDSKRFFLISFGSGGELETQIEIAKRVSNLKECNYDKIDKLLEEVMKMLNKLINTKV